MFSLGVKPIRLTYPFVLKSAASLCLGDLGRALHGVVVKVGVEFDTFVRVCLVDMLNVAIRNALVDMYAKCGNIEAASLVFVKTKEKDILTWTAMIWGWAIHGHFERAIQCFKEMMYSGIKPDGIVFLAILTACSYAGQDRSARTGSEVHSKNADRS
ncbi:hypothetical protein Patl1_26043 [Pistacia atlantica]|uniref:Uncharacterized protein n=1 Tax=Pistacia atlantica TaxID=434234 RepID=A0ACC1AYY9_9ROSI|nr:hypothetical protein Patl1_26043 [Pistacia atlantica]